MTKPLHSTTWRTESDCGVQVDVSEGRTAEWVPFREIVVTMDAGMTPAEARRLIADLQHAIALAEEFDAPEREDVSTEDQPKPRESVTYEQYAEAIRAAVKAQATSHQRHGMAQQPKTIYVGDMVKAAFDAAGIKVASVDLTALSEVLADSEQVRHG